MVHAGYELVGGFDPHNEEYESNWSSDAKWGEGVLRNMKLPDHINLPGNGLTGHGLENDLDPKNRNRTLAGY